MECKYKPDYPSEGWGPEEESVMFDKLFYVYIITNFRNGTLYIGQTDDLGKRMGEHIHEVFEGFSKRHKLKSLIWFEGFETRDEALLREKRMKSWKRGWKLKLIEDFNPHWIDINRSPVWPLPDQKVFPDLYADCLAFKLDPSLRWGGRK